MTHAKAQPPEPIVLLENVTFAYPGQHGRRAVLEDASLRIEGKDFLGIIGPNGGGKTTLLKIMLGLLKPDRGTVHILGQQPTRTRHRIGYVPQQAQFDATVPASVLDLVLTGRLGRSPWGAWFGKRHVADAMEALRQTESEELAHRKIGELSGGQRQRVLIARALAADAELLLLDEPTAGVDSHMERGLTDLLHQLNKRLPIVIVSHDISFVTTHLKRVVCLNRRLTCHAVEEISDEVISQMYQKPVRTIQHRHDCALADPGCQRGCQQGHGEGVSAD